MQRGDTQSCQRRSAASLFTFKVDRWSCCIGARSFASGQRRLAVRNARGPAVGQIVSPQSRRSSSPTLVFPLQSLAAVPNCGRHWELYFFLIFTHQTEARERFKKGK